MTAREWSLEVSWLGEVYHVPGVRVSESYSVDLSAVEPSYVPRTFKIDIPVHSRIGSMGVAPEAIGAILRFGDKIVSTSPITSYEYGPDGQGIVLYMEDRPQPHETFFPDSDDVRIKYLDVKASDRAENIARARAEFWSKHKRDKDGDIRRRLRPKWVDIMKYLSVADVYGQRVEGRVFPIVFGRPGRDGTPAVQALPYDGDNRLMMVCGHESTYGTVTLHRVEDGQDITTSTQTTEGAELDGRRITIIAITYYPGRVVYDDSVKWYVSFDGTASGISADPADVIGLLASRVRGIDVDVASIECLRGQLRAYSLDTALSARSTPWDLLTGTVLPLLPVTMVPTPKGLGFQLLRDVLRAPVQVRLVEGVSVFWNQSPIRVESGAVSTSWTIRYAYNAVTASYAREHTVSPTTSEDSAREATQASTSTKTIDCPWFYDDTSAQVSVRERASRTGRRYLRVGYDADPEIHGSEGTHPLSAGDIVTITHDALEFDARRAVVETIEREGRSLRIVLAVA